MGGGGTGLGVDQRNGGEQYQNKADKVILNTLLSNDAAISLFSLAAFFLAI